MGDGHNGRRCARVPEIVCGAHSDHILTTILIIAPARGLQRYGEHIMPALGEHYVAARVDLTVLVPVYVAPGTAMSVILPLS
jgi:hypothetical protein